MNGFCYYWRLDGQPVDSAQFAQCLYQSPLWQPDQQALLLQGEMAFSSTQRFVRAANLQVAMPYIHPESGCIALAHSFLTDRQTLAERLGEPQAQSDLELIVKAYLKWGEDCAKYLCGSFAFAIWDPRQQKLIAALDQLGVDSCFYTYEPGKYFVMANTLRPFRHLCSTLSLNKGMFEHFALDSLPRNETCYHEVKKFRAAEQITVTKRQLQSRVYWHLSEQKRKLPCKTRDDYYAAFRELFAQVVADGLETAYPVGAHISGGLDSSSVAAQAAHLLQAEGKALYGFTTVPQGLAGPSHRAGWYYHELPRVQSVLKQYANIEHCAHTSSYERDIYEVLQQLYPDIDQPYRNVPNFIWIIDSYRYLAEKGGRVLLTGQAGNGTISWAGQSLRSFAGSLYHGLNIWCRPKRLFDGYFDNHAAEFLQTDRAKAILRQRGIIINKHRWMLLQPGRSSRLTSVNPLQLYYGIQGFDPTADLRIVEWCYNVPQAIFARGRNTLQRRLLVREGLTGIVPEAIRQNPYRGEQAADWMLGFNHHGDTWRQRLAALPKQALLWQLYDREAILALFQRAPIAVPSKESTQAIACNLMRCISLCDFLNYLQKNE